MFPHRDPPRVHPGFSPVPHRQPPSSMGPRFHPQHRCSCGGPAHERLPNYERPRGPSPPPPPPHINGWRKRKNEDYGSPVLKRFRDDDDSSFMPYPPHQHMPPFYGPDQALAGSSRSRDFGHPQRSPHSHVHTNMPATCDGTVDLQVYVKDKVSAQMVELFEACQQRHSDLLHKEMCRSWLQQDMLRVFEAGRLYMTGSSMSGLASRSSDADLCYVLRENKPTHPVAVLSALKRMMKSLLYVEQPQLIRAKVPILRFREKGSNLEFDLNVNNTVGIRNTFLLKSYAYADPRVRPLILVIKKWARHHQINDASRGTLSSYTLVLMVLHYLQTLNVPVLPSLQKDYPECFDPSLEIDMIPERAQDIPPYNSQNNSSLGTLLLGFLKYYATEFSWKKTVISVRDAKAFTKQNAAKWRDKFISVEEPFESNNVARAVHEQAKFDAITSQFLESFNMLQKGKDLNSILPVQEIIHKELSWK
uniref:poly(A) RNA polymerase GLD2 n=1 Tax=Doryrhamphus excisus TaxID=161450 RepID=UPI0025ADEC5E|nr:poly(A) RNA polymerase GLD2 [Doryrhamphus excisus]XP_057927997.1 poly(A) RNA polymerase GLD2 [Doryrhamphus excisus]